MINKRGFWSDNLGNKLRLYLRSTSAFSCWIRTFLIIFVLTFLWVQIVFGNIIWTRKSNENILLSDNPTGKLISIKEDSQHEEQLNDNKSRTGNGNALSDVAELREKIKQHNEKQHIINEEAYGPFSNDSLVVVVQVHNRINYLKYLIESLSKAQKINEVLLIFSHDVYDNDINELIRSITFCKVMQIFLPYSVEAYPDQFPGNDPNDCPRDIGKKKALEIKCLGAEHPDRYGHYRESKFTQIKHHWWWKVNHVFSHLRITTAYTGLVTFLEDDHYVAEDFIYLLRTMDQKCAAIADCNLLGLGSHVNLMTYREFKNPDKVQINPLATNLGLTFNRTTFNSLLSCSKEFCEHDDYNWDWSLNYVVQKCGNTALRSMIPVEPRVFHTGECGIHAHSNGCKEDALIAKIEDLLFNAKEKLYPSTISISDLPNTHSSFIVNGGWGDVRDHELCISMTKR